MDDNGTNRYLLTRYAHDWGMECVAASTPAEGLAVLQGNMTRGKPFDVCILDGHMPGMDGFALARAIKADPHLADVKLMLLTSVGQRGDGASARQAGFGAYLTKPIRKNQLYEGLTMLMGESEETAVVDSAPLVTRHSLKDHQQRKGARILVADDHRVNQELALLMLERLGYRADVVANGAEAVEAYSKIPYSLIFMDCQMPEMDGYEATKEIRRRESSDEVGGTNDGSPRTMPVPIIAMTANAMEGDRKKCLDAGMDDYISKPVKPQQLAEIMDKWLPDTGSDFSPVKSEKEDEKPEAQDEKNKELSLKNETQDGIRTTGNEQQITSKEQAFLKRSSPIDYAVISEWRSMGGSDFVGRMLTQFVSDAIACVEQVVQAIEARDADAMTDAAFGLKGICRNVGAHQLAELAAKLESQCQSGSLDAVKTEVAEFKNELEGIDLTALSSQGKPVPNVNS